MIIVDSRRTRRILAPMHVRLTRPCLLDRMTFSSSGTGTIAHDHRLRETTPPVIRPWAPDSVLSFRSSSSSTQDICTQQRHSVPRGAVEWRVEGLDQEQISWLLVGPSIPFHSSSDPTSLVRALGSNKLWLQQHLFSHHWVVRRNPGSWPAHRDIWVLGVWSKDQSIAGPGGKIIKIILPNSSKRFCFLWVGAWVSLGPREVRFQHSTWLLLSSSKRTRLSLLEDRGS